jgi:hypothetical protein
MSIEGTWELTIATPIGRIRPVIELSRTDGQLIGIAHGLGEQVPLQNLALEGETLTWKQAVTKPMRLNLAFTVTIDGDTLTGKSQAGPLPASEVTGRRRTGSETESSR